ncbi:hypothetical protein B7463_g3539, partial [Scytalidium lignicola]
MLLTKRLSTFLNNNTTPQIHTLLLITPIGKLLSSASPSPASVLRTQSTLACSLWNLYSPYQPSTANLVSAALPQDPDQNSGDGGRIRSGSLGKDINCIVIQLEHGIMVIRALKCGLLFAAIGHSSSSAQMQPPHSPQSHYQQSFVASSHSPPPSSPDPQTESHHEAHENPLLLQLPIQTSSGVGAGVGGGGGGSTAPSEAGSTITNASIGSPATIFGMKRQTEELAKWLDGKLEGFKLSPSEGR